MNAITPSAPATAGSSSPSETPLAPKPGIRIVNTKGHPAYTKILSAATDEDLSRLVPISGVTIRNTLDRITASLEINTVFTDLVPDEAGWLVRHPVSGQLEPLAALEFADGTFVTFEDGVPKVIPGPPPERVTLKLDLDVKGMLRQAAVEMFGDDVPLPPRDATAEEMVNAIAFHLRLRAAVIPESTVAAYTRLINTDGTPRDVLPADFWIVLRPESVVGGPEPLGEPDAWVYVGAADGLYCTWMFSSSAGHAGQSSPGICGWFNTIEAAIKDAGDRAQGITVGDSAAPTDPTFSRWVRIERYGDRYAATTNQDPQTGAAMGLTAGPLDGALAFARDYLTAHKIAAT